MSGIALQWSEGNKWVKLYAVVNLAKKKPTTKKVFCYPDIL